MEDSALIQPSSHSGPAERTEESDDAHREDRAGIALAFDVIRNHTVHTKGYVMTALKFIEEFGNSKDKASLSDLLKEKSTPSQLATSIAPSGSAPGVAKRKAAKKK